MKELIVIGSGSFIGGTLRYLLSKWVQGNFLSAFPFGTFTVNVTGCFIIGLISALSSRGELSQQWQLFLATGICGGFTTFSAFSNETLALFREGHFYYAGIYIAASVLMGIAATFAGISAVRLIS